MNLKMNASCVKKIKKKKESITFTLKINSKTEYTYRKVKHKLKF